MAVSFVSNETIQPASLEFERTKYALTGFDLLMRYAPYQKRILFYDSVEREYQDVVRSLKESLSKALVKFHPLAGRITSGDGISSPTLELDCTQELLGVKFTEAQTDTTLKELAHDLNFVPCEFCDSLCDLDAPAPKFPWTGEHPLVFVQVTRFACGGLSVGVGFSHQAMDGQTAWNFITSWAELARTGNLDEKRVPKVFYAFKEPQLSEEELIEAGASAGWILADKTSKISLAEQPKHELKTKLFKLSKSWIDDLRNQAGSAKDGRRFSTYVVICAYFWTKATAARALTGPSRFLVLVSTRGKVSSVPESYFGNAVVATIVTAVAQDLLDNPLSYAATLLHEAIVNFDGSKAEKIVPFVSWCLKNDRSFLAEPFMMVVSSPRHPVYESDFGFGRPVGTTFGTNDLHQGKLYLFSSAKGDGVDAHVVLQSEAMERLLEDPSLSDLA